MWYWTCQKSPGVRNEHHSYEDLDELLTAHERGINIPGGIEVPGFRSIPACGAIHDYWDDGIPCQYRDRKGKRNCTIPYIPDPNGPDDVV